MSHTSDTPGGGGGGAPTDVDYLVGTADATLTNEIVVGTTPGGELGGTWGSPTVDSVHAGSAHHNQAHGESDHATRAISFVGPWWRDADATGIGPGALMLFENVNTFEQAFIMPWAGSIRGISVLVRNARTAGTLTVEAESGSVGSVAGTGFTAQINATDTQAASNTAAAGTHTFAADDLVRVTLTTDGSWAPTTGNRVSASLYVEFDT